MLAAGRRHEKTKGKLVSCPSVAQREAQGEAMLAAGRRRHEERRLREAGRPG